MAISVDDLEQHLQQTARLKVSLLSTTQPPPMLENKKKNTSKPRRTQAKTSVSLSVGKQFNLQKYHYTKMRNGIAIHDCCVSVSCEKIHDRK